MPSPDAAAVKAGQAVYTRPVLAIYDFLVLTVSNRWIWRCPTPRLEARYRAHLSANHLDVGVGTGYFLDRCPFPAPNPRLALMDLNPTALAHAAARVARHGPETYRRNVLEPIPFDGPKFDSIAVNYLLHCLPGSIAEKAVALDHLRALLNPGGVLFGSTILSSGVPVTGSARRLMAFYNRKGVFSNLQDDHAGLERELRARFDQVAIETAGSVALFVAQGPSSAASGP